MTAERSLWLSVAAGAAIVLVAALILAGLGHPWICTCGTIKFWHGITLISENSQHLTDWYTPSHVIHGILFYFGLWLVAQRRPLSTRALIALAIEAAWEVIENTPWIINRYREVTISLDYFGDSVINSVSDILAMLLGFWLAARAPVWLSVAVVIALEAIVAAFVRDNLTLNIIMLIYPLDVIRDWQAGG
jgi:hypothetical protein